MKPNSNGGVAGAAIKTALLWLFSYGDSRLYWYIQWSPLKMDPKGTKLFVPLKRSPHKEKHYFS